MPIQITNGRRQRAQKVLIYGVEGIGKTELVSKLPNPIFIDTEKGTDNHNVARIEVESSEQLDEALKHVLASGGYSTAAIDSIDWAEKLLTDKVCKINQKSGIEEFGYGKGWQYLREEFDKLLFTLDNFIRKGINVVLIGHTHIKKFQPPGLTDGYDRYELKLDLKNSARAREWADAVLFMNWHVTLLEGSDGRVRGVGGKDRVIHTTHCAAWDAKNRVGLKEKLKCEVSELNPIFNPVQEAESKSMTGHGTAEPKPIDRTVGSNPATGAISIPAAVEKAKEIFKAEVVDSPPAWGDPAESEPSTNVQRPNDLDTIDTFLKAVDGIPYEKVQAFLVNRGKLPAGGNISDVDPVYAKRALQRVDAFVKAVKEFQG